MSRIEDAAERVQMAHYLMEQGQSTKQMAALMNVSVKTAANYRNKVNRIIGTPSASREREKVREA